jgi:Xaa-Pro aminopeptidase
MLDLLARTPLWQAGLDYAHFTCFTGTKVQLLTLQPLWQAGLDYTHGTGHGVGVCVCVCVCVMLLTKPLCY